MSGEIQEVSLAERCCGVDPSGPLLNVVQEYWDARGSVFAKPDPARVEKLNAHSAYFDTETELRQAYRDLPTQGGLVEFARFIGAVIGYKVRE